MYTINFDNQTSLSFRPARSKRTLTRALRYLKIKRAELSVAFVTPATIKKLNSNYRRKNKVTDVLSFSYDFDRQNLNGEIVICYSVLKNNAASFKHSIQQELTKILIHSLLHLIGHTHSSHASADLMAGLERKIINSLKKS